MNSISIVIPFVNEKEEVLLTIDSIIEYSLNINYEIILINDASDDGFNYKHQLNNKKNVRYYENSHRIGVAASRDIGIMISTYDKFLLLDAHMRIYNTDTLTSFITALSENKNSIICCRTIGIGNNPRSVTPFAAFIEFWGEHGGLYAEWNQHDCNPESSSISPVPCILGAAYAAYKDYWIYLRGLSGLVSYGSDEAYISMKVWLSGGKCLVLKKVIIGHLYRKEPPYRIRHIDYVYNKILISLLLLPGNICLKVLDNLKANFRIQFSFSMIMIYKNLSNFLELKEYYHKILTTPFDTFFHFNNECQHKSVPEANIETDSSINISPRHYNFAKNNEEQDYGLYNGEMGLAILYYLQGEITLAEKKIDDIIEYIETQSTKISFDNGILGIAWGLNFFIEKKIIKSDINQLLSDFDNLVFNYFDMEYYGNLSFGKGLLGLIYYSTMRLYQDENILVKYPVFFKFLNKIIKEKYTEESSNLFETDFPFIALAFISFHDKRCKIIDCITSMDAFLYISNMKNENSDSLFYKGISSIISIC